MAALVKPAGMATFPVCPQCEGKCRLHRGTARETFCPTCDGNGRLHWCRVVHPDAFKKGAAAKPKRGRKR